VFLTLLVEFLAVAWVTTVAIVVLAILRAARPPVSARAAPIAAAHRRETATGVGKMPYVLKIVGLAMPGNPAAPCPEKDQYIMSFDPEMHDGRGQFKTSPRIRDAASFETVEAALSYWRTPSKVVPLRPDGHPNRPLTGFTIEVVPVEPEMPRPGRFRD
jgi:hypothetical protein